SSRFGPTTPFAFARASVWHDAHFCTNRALPFSRLSPLSLSSHPVSATAPTASSASVRTRPLHMARDATCWRGGAERSPDRVREVLELAASGRDHGPRDAIP